MMDMDKELREATIKKHCGEDHNFGNKKRAQPSSASASSSTKPESKAKKQKTGEVATETDQKKGEVATPKHTKQIHTTETDQKDEKPRDLGDKLAWEAAARAEGGALRGPASSRPLAAESVA